MKRYAENCLTAYKISNYGMPGRLIAWLMPVLIIAILLLVDTSLTFAEVASETAPAQTFAAASEGASLSAAGDASPDDALAGEGSSQDVTIHFGKGKDQSISIHVNPKASKDESVSLAGLGSEAEAKTRSTVLKKAEARGLLANYITDASLTIDGRTYGNEPWPVRPEADYNLRLVFTEKGLRQFPYPEEMVMVMPEGLTLKPGTSGTFDMPFGLAGTLRGNRWWVGDDGALHIQLANDPDELISRSNDARIVVNLTAQFDGSTTEFIFNDRVEREVVYDNTADVSINKNGSYNAATGKMDYVVTIKSTGKTQNIKVKDTIQGNMLTLDASSITVNPNKELTGEIAVSEDKKSFELTIKEMSHNETVTIRYSADVDFSKIDEHGKVIAEDGTNTLRVEPGSTPPKETTDIVNEIKYSTISKSATGASEVGEDGKKTLYWKIVANQEQRGSIVGSKIKDSIEYNSRTVMSYPDDLKLTVTVKQGDEIIQTLNNQTPEFITDEGNKIGWEYTIPQLNNENEIYTYEITYNTVVDTTKVTSDTTVKNNSEGEKGGHDQGTSVIPGTGPTPSDSITASKTHTDVDEEYVTWKITVVIPKEGYNDGFSITDTPPQKDIPDEVYGGSSYRVDEIVDYQISGLVAGETMEDPVPLYAKKDFEGQFIDVVYAYLFNFTYMDDEGQTHAGLKSTDNERILTLTVKTKNDEKRLAYSDTSTNYWDYLRFNNGTIKANGKEKPVSDSVSVHSHGVWKEVEGNSLPEKVRYSITFFGVHEDTVTFKDEFDTSVFDFALDDTNNGHELAIWGGDGNASYPRALSAPLTDDDWEYTTDPKGISLTATVPKKEDGTYYDFYKFTYFLKVKDGVNLKELATQNGGTYTVSNTAHYFDFTKKVDIDYEVPNLTKDGAFDSKNERLYHFTIDVNPEDATLSNGEMMELKDTHTENLSADYSSVKVYKLPENTTKDQRTADMIDPSIEWDFTGNTGTFRIPDRTHYVITYSALVLGSGEQSFSNYADLNGFHAFKSDKRTFSGSAEGSGTVLQINLLKYEKGKTSNGLQGAKFQLFKGTGEYDSSGKEIKEEMKYGLSGTRADGTTFTAGENITFTTGSNGTVMIALRQDREGNELDLGTRYYLKEIESPSGFQIDSSAEYWEFSLTMDPDEVNYGESDEQGRPQWIYFYYGDILKVSNTPTDQPLEMKVDKYWFDEYGQEITDETVKRDFVAKVRLLRKTDDGEYIPVKVEYDNDENPSITEITTPGDAAATVELNEGNNWKYSWSNLPRVKRDQNGDIENRYAYKIEEIDVDGYVVSVDETEDATTKTYALKNYEKPEEQKTNITVEKEWQNSEGSTITAKENLPDYIDFMLYQVSSKTPFTRVPTTGGTIYLVTDENGDYDSHLISGDPDGDQYGVYRVKKEEDWSVTFRDLLSAKTDASGDTMYYAYYVKEIPLTGYTTRYTNDGMKRTIVNKKLPPDGKTIDIDLEKKWVSGDNTTPPAGASATFTVHQQKSTKIGADGSITVTAGEYSISCNPGDTITVSYTRTEAGGDNIVYGKDWEGGSQWISYAEESGTATYTIPGDYSKSSLYVWVQNDHLTITSLSSDAGPGYSDYETTDFTRTITLPTTAGAWSTTVKDLIQEDEEGNLYRYFITEESCTPEALNTVFKDNIGDGTEHTINTSGQKVEVTNTYEQTTGFEFSKIWKDIDNQPTAWPEGTTITVTLNAYTNDKPNEKAINDLVVTLTKDGAEHASPAWTAETSADGKKTTFKVKGLAKYNSDNKELNYYIVESQVNGYQAPSYQTKSGEGLVFNQGETARAVNGQIVVNTPEGGYELPATGGEGRLRICLMGIALIVLVGAGLILTRRHRQGLR